VNSAHLVALYHEDKRDCGGSIKAAVNSALLGALYHEDKRDWDASIIAMYGKL